MEKTITTGTEITFKKTGDKFTLTKTDAGFDVKQIKLSKIVPAENYSFQELFGLYESGLISIEGFEEADAPLVKSILTNYIHTTEIDALKADITRIGVEKEEVERSKGQLEIDILKLKHEALLQTDKQSELTEANQALSYTNKELSAEIETLNKKIGELDKALEAMGEEK